MSETERQKVAHGMVVRSTIHHDKLSLRGGATSDNQSIRDALSAAGFVAGDRVVIVDTGHYAALVAATRVAYVLIVDGHEVGSYCCRAAAREDQEIYGGQIKPIKDPTISPAEDCEPVDDDGESPHYLRQAELFGVPPFVGTGDPDGDAGGAPPSEPVLVDRCLEDGISRVYDEKTGMMTVCICEPASDRRGNHPRQSAGFDVKSRESFIDSINPDSGILWLGEKTEKDGQ
jgi:hypothetical protein